jgi:hypothetical protein
MGYLQSILYGRPPFLDLAHSDCRFPRDLDPHPLPSGKSELGCEQSLSGADCFLVSDAFFPPLVHSWKAHYTAACLSVAVQRTSSVHRMSYSSLLDLDKRIRSFPLPSYLHSPMHGGREWDATPCLALQQFFAGNQRESSESLLPVYSAVFGQLTTHIDLLYIHRSWLAEALRDSSDPLQHEYGQSVVAVYSSANILINGMRSLTSAHPKVAGRVWFFWSCFYTSSVRMYNPTCEYTLTGYDVKVLLGAIVVKCPGCKLARPALALLNESFIIYEEGSKLCRPPATLV